MRALIENPTSASREHHRAQMSLTPAVRSRPLIAVLASPPATTSGLRTEHRVRLVADLLESRSMDIVNLLDVPTASVLDLSEVGAEPEPWLRSRHSLWASLSADADVLLGWGQSEPNGTARHHHRAQIAWLHRQLSQAEARVWTVGGTPRHPSRWQRYTSRSHPTLPFRLALSASLVRLSDHFPVMHPLQGLDTRTYCDAHDSSSPSREEG